MAFIFKYLWFIVIPVGLIVAALLKRRRPAVLAAKGVAAIDAERAYGFVALAMIISAAGIGSVQLMGGISNPFFLYSANLHNGYVLTAKLILVMFWLVLIIWIWRSRHFQTYAKLIVPTRYDRLLRVSKPIATVIALVGLSILAFYHGNRLLFVVTNFSTQTVEWADVINGDARYRIQPIPAQKQKSENVPLQGTSEFKLQYKMADQENPRQATVPFSIGEFSMGVIDIRITAEEQLHIGDYRMLK
jgi:hypothetical protein